ncbi:MAG TPA: NAD-dependent epimerase/dehydratase family protein [Chloroflexota bacterium]|nr:NAD-dependent epimerase/dehydratase family protein [Chloroflexota bacterium]
MNEPFASLRGQTCLVTGASGFLGGYVVERLVDAGASVRCLVRGTSRRTFLPNSGVQFCQGDVTNPVSLPDALTDVDFVFHVAGLIKAQQVTDYFRVNYLGTVNLLEVCRKVAPRVRRVVVVSSLAAAGPSFPGHPLDEYSLCHPATPYGKSKWQEEQAAIAFSDRMPITIVRPPTIYGPRDRETLAIFRLVAFGISPRLPVEGEISMVHASDLVDGIMLAATHPEAVGRTFFLANDEAPSLSDLLGIIGTVLGRRGVEVSVPAWALRIAGRTAEAVRATTGLPIIFDRWKAEEVVGGYWACSNARARRQLGFTPRIPLRDGLAETAQWYRAMGWL